MKPQQEKILKLSVRKTLLKFNFSPPTKFIHFIKTVIKIKVKYSVSHGWPPFLEVRPLSKQVS